MNREIIFRGKRTDNGEWVEGYYAHYAIPGAPFIGFSNSLGAMMWREVDPATVGQFTGLVDQNGVRIFEGDVVTKSGTLWPEKGVVVFGEGSFYYGIYTYTGWYVECNKGEGLHKGEKYHRALVQYPCELDNFYVIGNIHDNPELLQA